MPFYEFRQTFAGEVAHVLGLVEKREQMLEDDLDIWGVGLLCVGEEMDHLDEDGVDQLLGGVGGVAGDWKDHRHYFVQKDR